MAPRNKHSRHQRSGKKSSRGANDKSWKSNNVASTKAKNGWINKCMLVVPPTLVAALGFAAGRYGKVSIEPSVHATSAEEELGAKDANLIVSSTQNGDPWVDVVHDVIPPSVCDELIETSERIGFRLLDDSIDAGEAENYDQLTQEIYVMHRDHGPVEPSLYSLIEPHLPKLSRAIRRRRTLVSGRFANETFFTEPSLDWIFLRKYFPNSARHSLKVHRDSNIHSVSLALNDDYTGGGFFVVRPRDTRQPSDNPLDFPQVPYQYGSYRWLTSQKELTQRQNSTEVFFPKMPQGSGTLINFTVPHGVAPLAQETSAPRFALIMFYNMDAYKDLIREYQTHSGL